MPEVPKMSIEKEYCTRGEWSGEVQAQREEEFSYVKLQKELVRSS